MDMDFMIRVSPVIVTQAPRQTSEHVAPEHVAPASGLRARERGCGHSHEPKVPEQKAGQPTRWTLTPLRSTRWFAPAADL